MCRWMSTPSSVFAREAFLDEVAQALGFACNIFEGGTATAYQMEVSNRTDKGGMPFQIHGVVAAVDCGAGAAPRRGRRAVHAHRQAFPQPADPQPSAGNLIQAESPS